MIHDFIKNRHGRIDRSAVSSYEGHFLTRGVAIKFVLQGEELYEINGQQHPLRPGQLLLLEEGVPFGAHVRKPQPQIGMCIDIPQPILRLAYQQLAPLHKEVDLDYPQGFLSLAGYAFAQTLATFEQRADLMDWEGGAFEQVYFLADHLAKFIHLLRGERGKIPVVKASTADHLFQRLQVAKTYLHDTWQAPFSLGEVAKVAALSEYHLSRLFKACFGQTIFSYHEQLKMERAREMVLTQQTPIYELSYALGYEDTSYFIRRFKKHHGVSPGKLAG